MKLVGNQDRDFYDSFYKRNNNIWGNAPLDILVEARNIFDRNKVFIDLGSGQGRNSLFMANEGFQVEAIDFSSEALKQLELEALSKGILRIKTRVEDLVNFNLSGDYGVVGVINLLSLWEKKVALDFIGRIKEQMKKGTYIVLTGYLKDDVLYSDNKEGLFFEENELKELFSDFEIILYEEKFFWEGPHEGYEYEHKHSFCKIIAKKIYKFI